MLNPDSYITGSFYLGGKLLTNAPKWGMSLRQAGNMRFRWNETNPVRDAFLKQVAGADHYIVPVELIHSKKVYTVSRQEDTAGCKGDGIITANAELVPVVTAADCMPIFMYDVKTGVFGTLHSGWKGTGIVKEALLQAHKDFGSDVRDFCIVMAPHIHECCYMVDNARADYFKTTFTPSCIRAVQGNVLGSRESSEYALSLADANVHVLKELGIPEDNVYICSECTCCNEKFGSFRREAVSGGGLFTVQAAWIKW